MFFIIIALLIIAAIVVPALLLKINLHIEARDKSWKLYARALGIIVLRREYEARREHGDIFTLYCIKPKEGRVMSMLDIIKTIKKPVVSKSNEKARARLFAYVNGHSSYELKFRLIIGLDDAFATAMLCGLIQAAAAALTAKLISKRHMIRVDALPEFSKRSFSLIADCIISMSLANIIIGYMIYKIFKKGGDQYASNREYHADSNERDQGNGGRQHDSR